HPGEVDAREPGLRRDPGEGLRPGALANAGAGPATGQSADPALDGRRGRGAVPQARGAAHDRQADRRARYRVGAHPGGADRRGALAWRRTARGEARRSMKPPFSLVPDTVSTDTVECLQLLLKRA